MPQYILHPEVITRNYHGMAVRMRKVDDNVYIALRDASNLLGCGRASVPTYQICASIAQVVFYKNNKTLSAILPSDLRNLARRGVRAKLAKDQEEKITWLLAICKQIKDEESTPESALKIFSHPEFGDVRSIESDEGPMFCLADVCKALELSNTSKVKSRLDESDTQLVDLHALTLGYPTPVGNTMATFINESALYEVILRSDAQKARPFRKWVTKEVLPSIRKTGGYVMATPEDSQAEIMARGLLAAKETLDRMKRRAEIAENNLLMSKPKIDYYDAVVTNREFFTTTQIASELGMSYTTLRNKLFKIGVVTAKVGLLIVVPEHEDWGEEYRPENARRKDFKWNSKGRSAIFDLIAPTMPK